MKYRPLLVLRLRVFSRLPPLTNFCFPRSSTGPCCSSLLLSSWPLPFFLFLMLLLSSFFAVFPPNYPPFAFMQSSSSVTAVDTTSANSSPSSICLAGDFCSGGALFSSKCSSFLCYAKRFCLKNITPHTAAITISMISSKLASF